MPRAHHPLRPLSVVLLLLGGPPLSAQSADGVRWIWGPWAERSVRPEGEACALRTSVVLPAAPRRAPAWISSDNHFRLFVNDQEVARGDEWSRPTRVDLARWLRAGDNTLTARCWNDGSHAGFLFVAELAFADGTTQRIVSDSSWLGVKPAEGDAGLPVAAEGAEWQPARAFGVHGCEPWGRVLGEPATDSDQFETPPGFRVELVAEGLGSLIALAVDDRRRIYVAIEGGGVLRLADADGDATFEEVLPFTQQVTGCQGLLWHAGAMLCVGDGPAGTGLYRVADVGAAPELLGRFNGGMGEHGPHAIVAGPDGWLYVAIGNHASVAEPVAADSPYAFTYEGLVIPRYVDPRGHATECRAPGGIVARMDPATREWQHFAAGFRNHYDIAFDPQGELYTFDSDMEWDVGLPWYRPPRFVQVVAGGDYGWRTGSGCWPDWFADSLPPALETGRGSPTGLCCYTGRRFPPRFHGALLGGDWSQGLIFAFHPTRSGATVTATSEPLVRGRPLNVTDLVVDAAGDLLFTVGGRGTRGALFRLRYEGADAAAGTKPPAAPAPAAAVERARPRFDQQTPLADLLAALGDTDRFRRFAAGRALEQRDPASWERQAAARPAPIARAEALLAAARHGLRHGHGEAFAPRLDALLELLGAAPVAGTTPEAALAAATRLTALRALELLFQAADAPRTEAADPRAAAAIARTRATLLRGFPTGDRAADREIAQLLAFCGSAEATAAVFAAFVQEPSEVERIWLVYCLRGLKEGWTAGMRLVVARFVARLLRENSGGASFEGYLLALQRDLDPLLTPDERTTLKSEAEASRGPGGVPIAGGTSEARDLDRTVRFVEQTLHAPRRSIVDGALVFDRLCANCHQAAGRGKAVGPDLTTAAGRFKVRDLLEAILAPSRTVSDQYRAVNYFLRDGDIVSGLPILADDKQIVVMESTGLPRTLAAAEVTERRPATKSVMADGLLDAVTLEEIADLCAFLLAPDAAPVPKGAAPTWRNLFDGRSLDGFSGDPAHWSVADGVIRGRAEALAASSGLLFAEPLGDFILEVDLALAEPEQSAGIAFRSRDLGAWRAVGPRAGAGQKAWGSLEDAGGRGLLAQVKYELWHALADLRQFNHYVITAVGPRIQIEFNGATTVDLTDADGARSGLLGFQLLPGPVGDVRLKNVRLRTVNLPR